jgi:hypothetical protein
VTVNSLDCGAGKVPCVWTVALSQFPRPVKPGAGRAPQHSLEARSDSRTDQLARGGASRRHLWLTLAGIAKWFWGLGMLGECARTMTV